MKKKPRRSDPLRRVPKPQVPEYWYGWNDEIIGKCGSHKEVELALKGTLEDGGTESELLVKDGWWVVEVKPIPFVAKKVQEIRVG